MFTEDLSEQVLIKNKGEREFVSTNKEVVVSYIKAIYLDLNACCEEFVKGIELLEQCSVSDSVECFRRACESVTDQDRFFSKYRSYYGFSRLLCGDESAISVCRHAVSCYPFDGDICMNLARAEIFLQNRYEALKVIEAGLRFSAEHAGLKHLKIKLGERTRKPLPFLSRNNPLSAALGKKMRRKNR